MHFFLSVENLLEPCMRGGFKNKLQNMNILFLFHQLSSLKKLDI
jgi:hypothetical protein